MQRKSHVSIEFDIEQSFDLQSIKDTLLNYYLVKNLRFDVQPIRPELPTVWGTIIVPWFGKEHGAPWVLADNGQWVVCRDGVPVEEEVIEQMHGFDEIHVP